LQPLGVAGAAAHFVLVPAVGARTGVTAPTSVSLFDQGLLQMVEAAVTGLQPMQPYLLALSPRPDGRGPLLPLSEFTTNAAGAQVVNALGPIRQIVQGEQDVQRRFLVIVPGTASQHGAPVQIQANCADPDELKLANRVCDE
jgi:hypothetical protein